MDLADAVDRIVPEGRHYRHLDEGLDDMPAHVKVAASGCDSAREIGHLPHVHYNQ